MTSYGASSETRTKSSISQHVMTPCSHAGRVSPFFFRFCHLTPNMKWCQKMNLQSANRLHLRRSLHCSRVRHLQQAMFEPGPTFSVYLKAIPDQQSPASQNLMSKSRSDSNLSLSGSNLSRSVEYSPGEAQVENEKPFLSFECSVLSSDIQVEAALEASVSHLPDFDTKPKIFAYLYLFLIRPNQ